MKKIIILFIALILLGLALRHSVVAKTDDKGPLTKITFIHYKKGKEPTKGGEGKIKPGSTVCYKFLASGAKWLRPENFFVNPSGSNLSMDLVLAAINVGATVWEGASGKNIFGLGQSTTSLSYNGDTLDNYNVASFGSYPDDRVIAVTTVWGYFGGRTSTRQIVEWDMLFNTLYQWGDASGENSSLMDLQNIATHELGHSAGMGDLYTTSCQEETMYGYSTNGEIDKRDLGQGDITGINKLYSN